jgi:hypothetical protein
MVTDATSADASALQRSTHRTDEGDETLSRWADAFEDAASKEVLEREAQYERARALLAAQADVLMEAGVPDEAEDAPAHHAAYSPHRRPLSSAARRLMRAHERVEEAAQD